MTRGRLPARDVVTFGLDALAAYRATRLVTRDTITRPLRARVIRRAYRRQAARSWFTTPGERTEAEWDQLPHDDDDAPKLAALIVCPYCVGWWISVGVVVLRRYHPRLWEPASRALALSAAAALIGGLEAE